MASSRTYSHWTKGDLKFLRKWYPSIENERIANQLGRTIPSVVTKASRLRLKKSRRFIRMIARDNILRRYEDRLAG